MSRSWRFLVPPPTKMISASPSFPKYTRYPRPEIDPILEHAGADTFDVAEVSQLQSTNRRRHFRGGGGGERAKPVRKGTRSGAIEVFENCQHDNGNIRVTIYSNGLIRSQPQPARSCPIQHLEQVPQGEQFKLQCGARPKPTSERYDQRDPDGSHWHGACPGTTRTSMVATRSAFSVATAHSVTDQALGRSPSTVLLVSSWASLSNNAARSSARYSTT